MTPQRRSFILLFLANSISGVAQGISMIAIPWYFLTILNQPQLLGVVYFLVTFIQIFWGLYSGSLIDRYSRKKIFLYINAIAGAVLLLVSGIGFYLGTIPVGLIALVFATTFFVYNIHYPNLYAFAQEIIPKEHYNTINSQIEIVGQVTNAIAGLFASMLLTGSETGVVKILQLSINTNIQFKPWTLEEIFFADGMTYMISLVIISTIRYRFSITPDKGDQSVISRLKAGFDFLMQRKPLLLFGTASLTVFLTVIVSNYILTPTYIFYHLKGDAAVFGGMEVCFATGAIAAGLSSRYLSRLIGPIYGVLLLIGLCFLIYIGLLFNQSITLFFVLMMLYGLCNAGVRIMRVTYIFHQVPNYIFGRTGGVFLMIHILLRLLFIALFTLSFFSYKQQVLNAFAVFSGLLFLSVGAILIYRKKL